MRIKNFIGENTTEEEMDEKAEEEKLHTGCAIFPNFIYNAP